MRNKFGYVTGAVIFVYLATCALVSNWDRIEKENNAFAKDCNDRGGMVIFGMHARQCLGAEPGAADQVDAKYKQEN